MTAAFSVRSTCVRFCVGSRRPHSSRGADVSLYFLASVEIVPDTQKTVCLVRRLSPSRLVLVRPTLRRAGTRAEARRRGAADALAVMRSGSRYRYSRDWTWGPSRGRDLHFTRVAVMATSLWRPVAGCPALVMPPQVHGILGVLGSAQHSVQRHEPCGGIRDPGEKCGLEIIAPVT